MNTSISVAGLLLLGCLSALAATTNQPPATATNVRPAVVIGTRQPLMLFDATVLEETPDTLTVVSRAMGVQKIAKSNLLFRKKAQSEPSTGYIATFEAPAATPAGGAPKEALAGDDGKSATELHVLNQMVFTNKDAGLRALGSLPVLSSLTLNLLTNAPANLAEYTNWLAKAGSDGDFTEWYYLPAQNKLERFNVPRPAGPVRNPSWEELKAFLLSYQSGRVFTPEQSESRHFARDLMVAAQARGFGASLFQFGRATDIYTCVQFVTVDSGQVLVDVTSSVPPAETRPYMILDVVSGQSVQAWPLVFAKSLVALPPPAERGRNGLVTSEGLAQGTRIIP